jgi:hypothetical protein
MLKTDGRLEPTFETIRMILSDGRRSGEHDSC